MKLRKINLKEVRTMDNNLQKVEEIMKKIENRAFWTGWLIGMFFGFCVTLLYLPKIQYILFWMLFLGSFVLLYIFGVRKDFKKDTIKVIEEYKKKRE